MRRFSAIAAMAATGVASLLIGGAGQTVSAQPVRVDLMNPGTCPTGFTKTASSGAYPTGPGQGLVYTCQAVVNCPTGMRVSLNGPHVTKEQWWLQPKGPHMVTGGSGPFGPVTSLSGSGSITLAFTCSYTTAPLIK